MEKYVFLILIVSAFVLSAVLIFNIRLQRERNRLRASDAKKSAALGAVHEYVWEYDAATKRAKFIPGGSVIENVPECYIERGLIHPDYEDKFRSAYERVANGEKHLKIVLLAKLNEQDDYAWCAITFNTFFDKNGAPLYAIGILENVTENVNKSRHYESESQLYHALTADLYLSILYNVTKNRLEERFTDFGEEKEELEALSCDNLWIVAAEHVAEDESVREFIKNFNRESILDMYRSGKKFTAMEYLRRGEREHWVRLEIHLLCEPSSGDIKAFIYMRDIDKRMREIEALKKRTQTDLLTKTTEYYTAKEEINAALKNSARYFSLFLIKRDGAPSYINSDDIELGTANTLRKHFEDNDIIARDARGGFFVFCTSLSQEKTALCAGELCADLCFTEGIQKECVTFSIGVAEGKNEKCGFDDLYRCAQRALDDAQKSGANKFAVKSLGALSQAELSENGAMVQLSAVLENIDGAILIVEVAKDFFNTIYVSPSFFKIFSYETSGAKTLPQDIVRYLYPEDRESVLEAIHKSAQSGDAIDLIYRVRERGEIKWQHMRGTRIAYAKSSYPVLQMIITDVTELQNNAFQLKTLLDNALGGIARFVISQSWEVDFANDGFIKFFDMSREEFMERYKNDVRAAILPEDFERLRMEGHSAISRGRSFSFALRIVAKNGQRWLLLRAALMGEKGANPVVLGMFMDISEQKMLEVRLREDAQRLSLALEQTDVKLWEYDRHAKTLTVPLENRTVKNMPDGLNGEIHPGFLEEYATFFTAANSDERRGSAVLKKKNITDEYNWVRLSFRNIFDEDGKWKKTIGVTYRMHHIDAQKARFEQEEHLAEVIAHKLVAFYKVNMTSGKVEALRFNNSVLNEEYTDYDTMISDASQTTCDSEETYTFLSRFSLGYMINSFERGNTQLSSEYRRKSSEGKIEWVSLLVNMLEEPISGDIYAFGYVRTIDTRKKWELSLDRKAERDGTTLLYDVNTVRYLSNHVLNSEPCYEGQRCALAVLTFDGLDAIAASSGTDVMKNALMSAARICRILFDDKYIVGSGTNKRLLLFIPAAGSNEWIAETLNRAAEMVKRFHSSIDISENLELKIKCIVSDALNITFEALKEALTQRKGQMSVYGAVELYDYVPPKNEGAPFAGNIISLEKSKDAMSSEANAFVLNCFRLMMRSDASMLEHHKIFAYIGEYYGAARVYTLSVIRDGDKEYLTLNNEWLREGMESVSKQLSNVPLARFPIVKKTIETHKSEIYGSDSDESGWAFITVPILSDDNLIEVLCVDMPTLHQSEDAPLAELCAYKAFLVSEGRGAIGKVYIDELTGMFNRNKYSAVAEVLAESGISSLGTVFADINSLSTINHDVGNAYGDEMIRFAARVLEEQFGRENVYRISGDEFVVLAPNVVYEYLSEKAAAARAAFEKEYPSGISIGFTWSGEDIKVKSLVEHAEALMKINKQSYHEKMIASGDMQRPQMLENLLHDIAAHRFEMYLQPKADVKTGKIVGAEALVRYRDSEKGIVSPIKFIPLYERQNIIKHLDYFMFEEALSLMTKWKREGRELLPIAVNYSRSTLLDEQSLQKTKELRDKYSSVSDLFELEVTESIGAVEKATVAAACKKYKDAGFRLSLDDFGSEYSSLSIISVVDFDVLKIDKSIIDDIVSNAASRAITESTVQFCKKLGIEVVAEGVETEEQLETLRNAGCDIAQGYYFNKPLSAADFEAKYVGGAQE